MEEPQTRRAGNPQDWGSSGSWPEPRQARAGPSLSSVLSELPSAATVRYRGPGVLPWGGVEEEGEEEDRSFQALAEAAHQEQQDVLPSRELPWPMQARRAHRKSQARGQAAQASGSRVTHWTLQLRRSKEKFQRALQAAKPWAWTLKKIGGQFGAGTASYFSLLRFLLALNILASLLSVCMALLPTWLEGPPPPPPDTHNSTCGHYDPHLQGLVSFPSQLFSLLSGEGFLERSPLFYGFFPPRPRLAITYLSRTFAGGLLSLLLILHRSVSGLKQTLLAESGALTSYSHRVFSAWDFGLCGQVHVQLRRRQILGELKLELEEADVRRRAAVRTLGQQVWVWSVRALLNLLVCGLLAAAFYGVYWATGASVQLQEASIVQKAPLLKLVVDFLPSIFVSGVNFVLPPVFKLLAPLEGYTQSHQDRVPPSGLPGDAARLAVESDHVRGRCRGAGLQDLRLQLRRAPVLGDSDRARDVQAAALRSAHGPGGHTAHPISAKAAVQQPLPQGGRPGVPGARRGAGAHLRADGGLGGQLLLPSAAPAQHGQVPAALLLEEGVGWGTRGRRRSRGRLDGVQCRPPTHTRAHGTLTSESDSLGLDPRLPAVTFSPPSPPAHPLLHLLPGRPHLPGLRSEFLFSPGPPPGPGRLRRPGALQHFPDPPVQAVWPLPGPGVHLGPDPRVHPWPLSDQPGFPLLPGNPGFCGSPSAALQHPHGLHRGPG
ncbi:transmembrane channel-like protein 4 isoform X3 [Erinaceus europaeus]|uniref:Transmembrane channel-like protein 4 isoform X3 n=1 Tax=Erinaceus europaeus TaxID=9365 RepID=A0ABM3VWX0_ERIEU|nr:transmembrane channel-like protein 4 isoform X3 [Erinaceus europaeus]